MAHSLSPAMHRAALAATGLEGDYVLRRCDRDGFVALVAELRTGGHTGLNVTMPHKGLAYELSDRLTPEAEGSASVNTMRLSGDAVEGHSSDVVAFREILEEIGPLGPVLVLGSGGSARACIAAAEGEPVLIRARNTEAVERLRASFGERLVPVAEQVPGAVVVNATPIGMRGEGLDVETVTAASALVDLPYAAGETPAVALARSRGLRVYDGYDFLARQARVSFIWWTGRPVALSTMTEVARNT